MPAIPKNKPSRSEKHLATNFKGRSCYLRFPGICCGDPETIVPCHSPFVEDRHGTQKSDDILAVPGCHKCHDALDMRQGTPLHEIDRRDYYHHALKRWLVDLVNEGIIKIS